MESYYVFTTVSFLLILSTNAQYQDYRSFNSHFQYQQHYYRSYNEHRYQQELEQLKDKYCESPDYYQLFDISRDFTEKELKKQWKKLSRESHPDKNSDKENAEKQFQLVQDAYDVLKDEEARQKYDKVKEIYCIHYKPKKKKSANSGSGRGSIFYHLFFDETETNLKDIFSNDALEMRFAGVFPGIRQQEQLYLAAMIRVLVNFTKYFLLTKSMFKFMERIMISKK